MTQLPGLLLIRGGTGQVGFELMRATCPGGWRVEDLPHCRLDITGSCGALVFLYCHGRHKLLRTSETLLEWSKPGILTDRLMRIFYAEAVYGQEEINAVIDILRNKPHALRTGECVTNFESAVASLFGKKIGLMVNSGSSANTL